MAARRATGAPCAVGRAATKEVGRARGVQGGATDVVLHVGPKVPLAAFRVAMTPAAFLTDAPDGRPVRLGGGHEVAGATSLVAGAVGVDGLGR